MRAPRLSCGLVAALLLVACNAGGGANAAEDAGRDAARSEADAHALPPDASTLHSDAKDTHPDAGSPPADAGASPVPRAGCGKKGAPTGEQSFTALVAGIRRDYHVMVPALYDPSKPLAIAFVFHGAGGSIDTSKAMGLQGAPGAAANAIFVFAQGILLKGHESLGTGWNQTCGEYDMTFFNTMLDAVESKYCVDQRRVFATGFSWGADMADALACCLGGKLRAVAPASGDEIDWNKTCPAASSTPALRLTYGDGDGEYTQQQFADSVTYFRTALKCSAATDPYPPTPCVSYRGCDKPVISCKYSGMGHATPAGWPEATWAFFSTFR